MKRTLNCRGQLLDLSNPKVMGILNFTPDSFFSESRVNSDASLISKVNQMLTEGATFIDIGAYSSRPGADFVSYKEERNRIIPAIDLLVKEFPKVFFSVDTFRSEIAKEVVDRGASIINDISGGNLDDAMLNTIAKLNIPYVLMHMRGTPKTMSKLNNYNNLITEVISEIQEKTNFLINKGHNDIIIDPGLGFAKDINQNYEIVKRLKDFEILGLPILIGASRKSMIYKLLDCNAEQALNGSTVVHTASLLNGAKILRVHDVKEAMEAIKITNLLQI